MRTAGFLAEHAASSDWFEALAFLGGAAVFVAVILGLRMWRR